jgi:hypothetical protein
MSSGTDGGTKRLLGFIPVPDYDALQDSIGLRRTITPITAMEAQSLKQQQGRVGKQPRQLVAINACLQAVT